MVERIDRPASEEILMYGWIGDTEYDGRISPAEAGEPDPRRPAGLGEAYGAERGDAEDAQGRSQNRTGEEVGFRSQRGEADAAKEDDPAKAGDGNP